jgi:hypothetical protein
MRRLCIVAVLLAVPGTLPAAEKEPAGKLLFLGVAVNTQPDVKHGGSANDWNWCPREIDGYLRRDSKGLFKEVQTRLVLGKQATPAGARAGLQWLKDHARPGDLAVIEFGCHGGGDSKEFVLCLQGDDFHGPELKAALEALPCQVLLALDCCDAGEFVRKHATEHSKVPANAAVLCACRPNQPEDVGLTIALAEALAGKADHNGDGKVTFEEVFDYVPRRMHEFETLMKDEAIVFKGQAPVIAVGDRFDRKRVLVRRDDRLASVVLDNCWYAAEVVDGKGDKPKVRVVGTDKRAAPTPRWQVCFPHDGKPVVVQKGKEWVPAVLIKNEGDRKLVRLVGKTATEEHVPSARVRFPFVIGPVAPAK